MTEVSPDLRPESGFLLRLRTWRDALPWLALTDCLRPATSVINLTLIGLTFWLSVGADYLLQSIFGASDPSPLAGSLLSADATELLGLRDLRIGDGGTPELVDAVGLMSHPSVMLLHGGSAGTIAYLILHQLLLVIVWAVPAAYLMRQCALSMAGRLTMGTGEGLRLAARRFPALMLAVLIPVLAVAIILVYFLLSGLVAKIPAVGEWLAVAMQLVGLPLAIAAGLLGFGGLFAVPLAWAAVAVEQEGSGFDGISRGYEYVLRRPLQLVLYGVIAAVIIYVLSLLARGVTAVTWWVVAFGYSLGDANETLPTAVAAVIYSLPWIVLMTLFWSLIAGLYLLLRRSANHQEVEDVWETPRPAAEPLPELKV